MNSGFSDHNTVTCRLNMMCHETVTCKSIMKYITAVPNFGWRSGSSEKWESYENSLYSEIWSDISVGMNFNKYEDL